MTRLDSIHHVFHDIQRTCTAALAQRTRGVFCILQSVLPVIALFSLETDNKNVDGLTAYSYTNTAFLQHHHTTCYYAMEARQIAAEAAVFDQTNLLPRKKLLVVFSALALSHFICFVDQTGIGVALPTIGRDLNAEDTISWAGTSALIANTIFQVLYGRMSDLFGMSSGFGGNVKEAK